MAYMWGEALGEDKRKLNASMENEKKKHYALLALLAALLR